MLIFELTWRFVLSFVEFEINEKSSGFKIDEHFAGSISCKFNRILMVFFKPSETAPASASRCNLIAEQARHSSVWHTGSIPNGRFGAETKFGNTFAVNGPLGPDPVNVVNSGPALKPGPEPRSGTGAGTRAGPKPAAGAGAGAGAEPKPAPESGTEAGAGRNA